MPIDDANYFCSICDYRDREKRPCGVSRLKYIDRDLCEWGKINGIWADIKKSTVRILGVDYDRGDGNGIGKAIEEKRSLSQR